MSLHDKKLDVLFQSAKTIVRENDQIDNRAPFGFSTRVVQRYFHKTKPMVKTWKWESFILKAALGVFLLSGVALWVMRNDLEVYSDEYIEARMIDQNMEQEIL